MLDEKSIDVIARFKSALLTRSQTPAPAQNVASSYRGKKLTSKAGNPQALTPKIVEYDGSSHLVLTNDVIERTNYNNKRRWSDFYRTESKHASAEALSDDDDSAVSSDAESDDERYEENPLKKLRLSEILAPLTHPSELNTHPGISKTYKSTSLAVLAAEIIETIEIEQNTLNQYNKLLQVLDGDDWFFQLEENMELPRYDHGLDDLQSAEQNPKEHKIGSTKTTTDPASENDESRTTAEHEEKEYENKRITRAAMQPEGQSEVTDPFFALPKSLAVYERQQPTQTEGSVDDDDELAAIQRELINYLQVSIQRQQEYIKNLTTIRNGLVKADRYKKDLLKWGKEMGEKKY